MANTSFAQSNDPFEHTSKGTPIDVDSEENENDDNRKVPDDNVKNKRTDNLKVKKYAAIKEAGCVFVYFYRWILLTTRPI